MIRQSFSCKACTITRVARYLFSLFHTAFSLLAPSEAAAKLHASIYPHLVGIKWLMPLFVLAEYPSGVWCVNQYVAASFFPRRRLAATHRRLTLQARRCRRRADAERCRGAALQTKADPSLALRRRPFAGDRSH